MDATAFLAKLSKHSKLVVYCDPPYVKSSDVSGYGTSELDLDALTDALKKCKGFAAVTGYKDDWDHLGWHRYELDVATGSYRVHRNKSHANRSTMNEQTCRERA